MAFLELLGEEPFQNIRSEPFAHLQGLARLAGLETRWLVMEAGAESRPENPYVVEPPQELRDRLAGELETFGPTIVISNERLGPQLVRALETRCQCRILLIGSLPHHPLELLRLMIDTGPASLDLLQRTIRDKALRTRLLGEVPPDYEARVLNPGPITPRHFTTFTVGLKCVYRRPVRTNEVYADVSFGWDRVQEGCAFCSESTHSRKSRLGRVDPVEKALLHLRRFHETAPRERRPGRFLINGIEVFHRLEAFMEGIWAADLPGSTYLFNPRVDEFLAKARIIEAFLPRLSRTGHRLHLWSLGVENFSPDENGRFNKNVRPEQVFEAHEILERLEDQWPEALYFRQDGVGGFALMLFTPWTTPEDLALNVEGIRRTRIGGHGDLMISRLQIIPGTAISHLARRDGLLLKSSEEIGEVTLSCMKEWDWDQNEIRWRFGHKGVSALYQILIRIDAEASEGDELEAEIASLLEARPMARRSRLEIMADAVEILRRDHSLEDPARLVESLRAP